MKKINLLIACSFSLLLAGCNNEVDVNKRSAYTEEEKTLMIEKLNGNIIPFYYVKDMRVTSAYYDTYGCITVEAPLGTKEDLYNYETVLIGEDFTKSFGVGDYEKDLNKGQYYLNLKGGRFVVEFSLTNTGSWAVDGFYQQSLKNYTVPNISTYDGLVEAAALPFMDEYGVAPTLPEEITFTPESYRLVDYRYNLIITNGNDIGHPAVLLGFIGATLENKDALINSFVSVGYTEKVVDDVTFYESNASAAHPFGASFNYYEAEVDKEGNVTSPSMVVVLIV
ncbi:MAG: hypothetical protein SO206_03915 [Bacilli bacterium]|nr:hypothetical protein [Bacilli bacterium]